MSSEVCKIVLVEHSPERMFALVDAVEDYPAFLPWCGGTAVLERSDTQTVAELRVNYHGIRTQFSTVNAKQFPQHMHLALREGPFRHLTGDWHFKALGGTACRIEFSLRYEFSNRLLELALGPVFNHIASTFVDAFVRRADQLHGGAHA